MADKGLNLSDDFAAECVHLCPQEEGCTSSSWGHSKMYTPGTIANSDTDRTPIKINKNGAQCCCQSKNFSGIRDTIRHLKTFRVISNEMPVLLILCYQFSLKSKTTEGNSAAKKNFMAPFYGRGSTASRLEPLRRGSLLFTTKLPEIPGTHFIDHGRMKG